jgi:Ras-related protein Rab-2A
MLINIKMSEDHPDMTFKIIIIGDSGVGKSCFFMQFTEGHFKEDHNVTIGVEYGARLLNVDDKIVKLELWDTAGQEAFRAITRSFYRNANGVILMYDLTNLESFENLEDWLREVRTNSTPDVAIILVGNMLDLEEEEREVNLSSAQSFATENKLDGFFEASAKTSDNVVTAFMKMAEILKKKNPVKAEPKVAAPIQVKNTAPAKQKKGCC